MKRWKVKVELVAATPRKRIVRHEWVNVQAVDEKAAQMIGMYVAAHFWPKFDSYEPVEWIHEGQPQFHELHGPARKVA